MSQDLYFVFHWWLLLFFLGICTLPSLSFIFAKAFDGGYACAKTVGILSVSYIVWTLGSIKLVSFTFENSWWIVFFLAIISVGLFAKNQSFISNVVRSHWKIWLIEEALFLLTLTGWSYVRGFQPDIRGLEKFMDFGFVNAILQSSYFPPYDMWFSGEHINYYYFGHLTTAVLTRLSGISSSVTYNLMVATLFSLTFTGAFSFGSTLSFLASQAKKPFFTPSFLGLLTALILTLSSNLHSLYWLITKGSFSRYWYPDATRFIVKEFGAQDNTIHEFPIYSFVVADLHGHLVNLPFVIFFLMLMIIVLQNGPRLITSIIASWLLGIFYITNAWDLPIYSLTFALIVFFSYLQKKAILRSIRNTILWCIPTGIGSLIFSLPFQLSFKSITKGIALADFHTPLWMLLVLWGLPLIITFSYLIFLVKRYVQKKSLISTDYLITTVLIVSWILILFPEILYVKDIYIHEYQRANTMFKFTYQSFVLFALSTPYILWRITLASQRKRAIFAKICYLLPVSFLILLTLSYPYFALRSYYGLPFSVQRKAYTESSYKGLDGTLWLTHEFPGEYRAIQWIKQQEHVGTVLQAVGDSYTDYNVISSYTGIPTVQGWVVHEWLWRGSYDQPEARARDTETIYITDDKEKTRTLLSRYNISYVVVGQLERQKYQNLQEDKFKIVGQLAFSSSGTTIYKVN